MTDSTATLERGQPASTSRATPGSCERRADRISSTSLAARLVAPTLRALADEDLLVVAAGVGVSEPLDAAVGQVGVRGYGRGRDRALTSKQTSNGVAHTSSTARSMHG
jgi:hypothetical protein